MNPRYIAYAKTHGKTPDAMLAHDTAQYPGGKMCGFILWISEGLTRFRAQHPECFIGQHIRHQDLFTKFLQA